MGHSKAYYTVLRMGSQKPKGLATLIVTVLNGKVSLSSCQKLGDHREMYYLNNICFLCLTHNNNIINHDNNYLKVQRKLKYIVPEEMLTNSDIPKYICDYCVERLNSIYKFRRKCLKSIVIFNEYVQTLTQNSNSFRNLSINLTDTVHHENIDEIDNNIENTDKKLICFQEIKIEMPETDAGSVVNDQIEDIINDTNNVNQVVIKTENLDLKREQNEELIIKDELCFSETIPQENFFEINNVPQNCFLFDEYVPEYDIKNENYLQENFCEENNLSHKNENNQLIFDNYIPESDTKNKSVDHKNGIPTSHSKRRSAENSGEYSQRLKEKSILIKIQKSDEQRKRIAADSKAYRERKKQLLAKESSLLPSERENTFETVELIHTGEMPYAGDVCKNTFTQKHHLSQHSRIHSGDKPYECDVCKRLFNQISHLNYHKCIHAGENLHVCDVCEKSFNRKSNLDYHKRIHTGEKPYACDVCNKTFTVKSNLTQHKMIHTGERPHACDICRKAFRQKFALIRHKRIHTGEMPFACDVCKKTFIQKNHFNKHKRSHTREKP